MKTHFILKTIFLSLLVNLMPAGDRCGFADAAENYLARGIKLDRPVMETFLQTPSGNFYLHYDESGPNMPLEGDENLNNIPDYIEELATMTDSAWHVLVDIMDFNSPPDDDDGIYDIYVKHQTPGTYGVTHLEGNGLSYIEIDNDFSEVQYSTHGVEAMQVTIVHEFFHSIQLGYIESLASNTYFYEMSSTWIEDIIVPDVNDYLEFRDELFNDPTQSINHTNGYSIALYGHYLSLMVEGVDDELESIIIRQMWEEFAGPSNSALNAIETVLNENYNSSICESWTDFLARTFFNSLEPEYYYHPDQAEIEGLSVDGYTPVFMLRSDNLFLEDNAAAIKGYRLSVGPESAQQALLSMSLNTDQATTRIAITGSQNLLYDSPELVSQSALAAFDKIHLLTCSENLTEITATLDPTYGAAPPGELKATILKNQVFLSWVASPGPGPELSYNIFRSGDHIATVSDTVYFDTTIESEQNYIYYVTAVNLVAESLTSNTVEVTTWPSDDTINRTAIYQAYPNPIHSNNFEGLTLILDANRDYPNPKIALYNLLGEKLMSSALPSLTQGRHLLSIGGLADQAIPSGIYFLVVSYNSGTIKTHKFSVIN